MSDKPEVKKPIEPPSSDREKELARGIAEAAVELIPGGGVITNILSVMRPSENEQQKESWQKDVSERVNENTGRLDTHESILNPRETLTGVAAQLAMCLSKACPDGLGYTRYTLEEMAALLPGEEAQAIEDAAYELNAIGLIEIERTLSGPWRAVLNENFYEQIDHQTMGWNTSGDAVVLAQKMLEMDTGDARELHQETGWNKRRFNPVFRHIVTLIPEGRVRRSFQPDYPCVGALLIDEDKAQLRRFIKKNIAN